MPLSKLHRHLHQLTVAAHSPVKLEYPFSQWLVDPLPAGHLQPQPRQPQVPFAHHHDHKFYSRYIVWHYVKR